MSNTARLTKTKRKRKQLQPDQFHVSQICMIRSVQHCTYPWIYAVMSVIDRKTSSPRKVANQRRSRNICIMQTDVSNYGAVVGQ